MKKLIRPILTAVIVVMASSAIFAGTTYVPHVGGTGLDVRLLHNLFGVLPLALPLIVSLLFGGRRIF